MNLTKTLKPGKKKIAFSWGRTMTMFRKECSLVTYCFVELEDAWVAAKRLVNLGNSWDQFLHVPCAGRVAAFPLQMLTRQHWDPAQLSKRNLQENQARVLHPWLSENEN